ncbi:MAG: hypothetical protein U9Q15_05370 [Patescibacteria group bacterium]|nr:hypothetical protein [Patescibacteria group bacterium]
MGHKKAHTDDIKDILAEGTPEALVEALLFAKQHGLIWARTKPADAAVAAHGTNESYIYKGHVLEKGQFAIKIPNIPGLTIAAPDSALNDLAGESIVFNARHSEPTFASIFYNATFHPDCALHKFHIDYEAYDSVDVTKLHPEIDKIERKYAEA